MEYTKEFVDNLVMEYGSPIYIFDKEKFIKNYNIFVKAMRDKYDKYYISYSYKTNYAPYICKLIKELDGYAEVVSDMEYYFAKKIGYDDNKIIYNGPYKGELSHKMIFNGGLVNIDSLDELDRIILLAAQNTDKTIKIGLRLNVDIGQSFISRFGIDIESNDFEEALNKINKVSNLEIQGLHLHVGQSRTVLSWENRAKKMLEVVDKYFNCYNLKYLDLGSGMYGEMVDELGNQFSKNRPKYDDYAEALNILGDYYKNYSYNDKPIIFTEPGTTLINHYIDFIGKVFSIKTNKGQDIITLNCSKHNLGEICTLKKLPLKVIHTSNALNYVNNANIVGYTCLEHDVMYKGYTGQIGIDDYMIFGNIGGYSNVDKPPFILPNCAMVSAEGDKVDLIKRKETYEDILSTYVI